MWQLTQATELHPQWDLRFTSIRSIGALPSGGYRFRYTTALPFHTITGIGTTIGEIERADGSRTSALRFESSDRLSPIRSGRGFWRYVPDATGVTFSTGYDYTPGGGALGAILDRLVMRRLIGWMTAWSFDRLRIWAETGEPPARWSLISMAAVWRNSRPQASRCERIAPNHRAMDGAPDTLAALEAP